MTLVLNLKTNSRLRVFQPNELEASTESDRLSEALELSPQATGIANPRTRKGLHLAAPASPTVDNSVQDCGSCKKQKTCWADGIKNEHIITNLLVCRIKRGIDVNRSCKLLLQMLRPKLKLYAKQAIRGTSIPVDTALADLESQTIEYIQNVYVMGEVAYPLHYLFGQPHGVIRHFANNYARKQKKYEDFFVSIADDDESLTGGLKYSETPQGAGHDSSRAFSARLRSRTSSLVEDAVEAFDASANTTTEETELARQVINDGKSLNLLEFTVMSFCLQNAQEAKRPLNGLHIYLSKTLDIPRAKVTKVYADASKKVVNEVRRLLEERKA